MIRTVTLTHADGRTTTMATAMDFRFLERMFPGWTATEPTTPNEGYRSIRWTDNSYDDPERSDCPGF